MTSAGCAHSVLCVLYECYCEKWLFPQVSLPFTQQAIKYPEVLVGWSFLCV
jgi:hypothetical protein